MSSVDLSEQSILDEVRTWQPQRRAARARQILATLHSPSISIPLRRLPLEAVFGLLKTDRPAPTDEECRRIIEEERMRKHG